MLTAQELGRVELARRHMVVDVQHALMVQVGLDIDDKTADGAEIEQRWRRLLELADALQDGRARWLHDPITARRVVVPAHERGPDVTEERWRAHAMSRGLGDRQIDGLLAYAGSLEFAILLTRRIGTPRGVIWTGDRWTRQLTHLPAPPGES
jgi:hypothetical protein